MNLEIGVLLGALTGLTPIIMGQIEKRGKQAKKINTLGLVQKRVEYLSAWVKAQEQVCLPEHFAKIKDEAATELRRTQEDFMDVFPIEEEVAALHAEKSLMERWFLMYSPKTIIARVWQVLFYGVLGIIFCLIFILSIDENTGSFSQAEFIKLFDSVSIFMFTCLFFIAIAFRRLFIRAEKKAEKSRILLTELKASKNS